MDIAELRKELPIGGIKRISEMSRIPFMSVQRFFSGIETKQDIEIMNATTKFLKEHKEKRAQAIKDLQSVIKES